MPNVTAAIILVCMFLFNLTTDDMNFEMDVCEAYEAINAHVWQDFQNHYYEAVTLR